MHVRIARFENVDAARVDEDAEQFRKMLRSGERPEWMPEEAFSTLRGGVVRVISLVDRAGGHPRSRLQGMRRMRAAWMRP